jgi:hypothetical protein
MIPTEPRGKLVNRFLIALVVIFIPLTAGAVTFLVTTAIFGLEEQAAVGNVMAALLIVALAVVIEIFFLALRPKRSIRGR